MVQVVKLAIISGTKPWVPESFFCFRGEAAIVSGEASIEIMAIAASPLTIQLHHEKKNLWHPGYT